LGENAERAYTYPGPADPYLGGWSNQVMNEEKGKKRPPRVVKKNKKLTHKKDPSRQGRGRNAGQLPPTMPRD